MSRVKIVGAQRAQLQSCDRGNACLTCDKFATDKTFLPELKLQQNRTLHLVEDRQQAFRARTGTPMGEDNVWRQGRLREVAALDAITTALDADHGQVPGAIRGAGAAARAEAHECNLRAPCRYPAPRAPPHANSR